MEVNNDLNKATNFWRKRPKDVKNRRKKSGDSSTETSPFRGFEKDPKVVIEKLNIEPFLMDNYSGLGRKSPNDNFNFPQLVSECFIKLVNDDLGQLRRDILENSRLNKITTNLNMPLLHCKICEKAYSNEKKLQNHLENRHMVVYKSEFAPMKHKRVSFSDNVIVHEIKEYHRCRKCTKIFEQYQSLKTHMKQEHRKRKCYICHYCSKNFVDRMIFKVHIKHHCDVCGLLLPNKRSYMSHKRDMCRVIKKYPCKTCGHSFFSYMDLKEHSYDHLEELFICDICKEQHRTKCAVAHHIFFLHSKHRSSELYTNMSLGTERLYLCSFCDVSSIDKDTLEKHVFSLPDLSNMKRTGYRDYYFCDQCPNNFETESDMLQHKWTHFLSKSENPQVLAEDKPQESNDSAEIQNNIQKIFKINEKWPTLMQPKVVLERVDYVKPQNTIEFVDSNNIDSTKNSEDPKKDSNLDPNTPAVIENAASLNRPIVDPKSKKTLISRFQCELCHKYYSSNYSLNRHLLAVHNDYSKLRCLVCEEIFVWPSLLQAHRCIRVNIPEMPFEDARPEIQFDNCRATTQDGIDELMDITQNEDYMTSVDFEIPAPIVELTEYDSCINTNVNGFHQNTNYDMPVHHSYKIVMQEVPIEF